MPSAWRCWGLHPNLQRLRPRRAIAPPIMPFPAPCGFHLVDTQLRWKQFPATGQGHGKARHVSLAARLHIQWSQHGVQGLATKLRGTQQVAEILPCHRAAVTIEIIRQRCDHRRCIDPLGGLSCPVDGLPDQHFVRRAMASGHRQDQQGNQRTSVQIFHAQHPVASPSRPRCDAACRYTPAYAPMPRRHDA